MNVNILKKPVITEKSIKLASLQNTYTFQVVLNANKNQIKEAVEKLFKVSVIRVNTKTKHAGFKKTGKKRLKKRIGRTKYALVTLKKDDHIKLFDTYK
jgi:large subunit ribosomal protein L23